MISVKLQELTKVEAPSTDERRCEDGERGKSDAKGYLYMDGRSEWEEQWYNRGIVWFDWKPKRTDREESKQVTFVQQQ